METQVESLVEVARAFIVYKFIELGVAVFILVVFAIVFGYLLLRKD